MERVETPQVDTAKPEPIPAQVTGCEKYRPLVEKYFPPQEVNNALLTMQKESSCRSDAYSSTNDYGLMQINAVHADMVNGDLNALYEPETNVRVAYQIFTGRNWNAWYGVKGILW